MSIRVWNAHNSGLRVLGPDLDLLTPYKETRLDHQRSSLLDEVAVAAAVLLALHWMICLTLGDCASERVWRTYFFVRSYVVASFMKRSSAFRTTASSSFDMVRSATASTLPFWSWNGVMTLIASS